MKKWAIPLLTTMLSGCGTYLPQLTSRETLPLEVLIAKINCEFQVAVWTQRNLKGRTFLAGWQGQYGITLKSNEAGTVRSLNNTFPFLPAKNLGVTGIVGAGESTTANRTALMKFSLAFDDVKQEPVCARVQTNTLHPFITGRIGFEEWMDRVFDAAEVGGKLQLHKPQRISSVGHTFQFTIVVNANAGAGFVIGPAPTIGINANATIERLDDGSIDVVIAKPAVDPLPQLLVGLTNAERELIAKLEELISQKRGDIAKRTQEINSQNAALVDRLSRMDSKTIQNLSPTDDTQLRTFNLNRPEAEQLKSLNDLRDANRTDEQEILGLRKQLADVRPRITGVTIKPHVLPPDRNPEIIYTTQQLTLERLNNSLRVIP
ncbi:hypothetical protein [Bradyrhizobium sp. AUGA SZCCT0283]|uniref:hypothetical protein n=1 Tax=Bradyrhizobium sp. AUGA SZCCT0283 TaxID=2807671 RepID=UPI001BA959B7|nr:hypothetical protein [Bradyrhizobium sp. AUGA SZCCT0283]MBR1277751.1 hypothetical protein [Bradyrhizobium sp. AUGA SZCCT0283]